MKPTFSQYAVEIVLVLALIPVATLALVEPVRNEVISIVETVKSEGYTQVLSDAQKNILAIGKQKKASRDAIAEKQTEIAAIANAGIDPTDEDQVASLLEQQRDEFVDYLRNWSARQSLLGASGYQQSADIVRDVLVTSIGEVAEQQMRDRIVMESRQKILAMLSDVPSSIEELALLEQNHRELQTAYIEALKRLEIAEKPPSETAVGSAPEPTAEVVRITNEVKREILRLQAELARIDARLRRQAERKLIEMGLLDPQEGVHTSAEQDYVPTFTWPVAARVSAGYRDGAYYGFFGVPHNGVDMVVPQGTAVRSAAEGVVFLARDGGKYGYSYVLIGHRGGFATLYGHLSSIGVTAGQEVYAGQVIGSSGGTPGTYGAGPMTTGAHLHFEMIVSGSYVNPLRYLP